MDVALVFAGGGAKGAYEIGVWKAIHENRLETSFNGVIGTSVGALNAVLFGQQTLDTAVRVWEEISHGKMLVSNVGGGGAVTSQDGLKNLLQANLSGNLQKNVYVCCSRVEAPENTIDELTSIVWAGDIYRKKGLFGMDFRESIFPEYIKLNGLSRQKQIQYLLASAALPGVYDAVCIDGKKYRDGGIIPEHNFPYEKALALGYQKVLAVNLRKGVSGQKKCGRGQVFTLCPSRSLGETLDGTIDFDAQNARWRINLGYEDFMRYKRDIISFMRDDKSSSRMPDYIKNRLKRMV